MRRLSLVPVLALAAFFAFAASASGAPRLYQPDYDSSPAEFAGFGRGADGSLSPLAGSPFTAVAGPPYTVSSPIATAFAPEGERAVVSFLFNGGVQGLAVAADGSLSPSGASIVTPSATGLAVSPDGRFAYIPTRDFMGVTAVGVIGYAVAADGSLTPLPGSPYDSGEFGDIAVSPDGRFLLAARPGQVRRFAIGSDGRLTALGDTTVPGVQTLTTGPDGRLLFAAVEQSGSDGVVSLTIGGDGGLTQNGPPALTGDVSIDFIAVSPDGRRVYMPDSNLDAVVIAAVAEDGALSVIGSTAIADIESVAASPDGRFLYLYDRTQIITAAVGPDGIPSVLPLSTPLDMSTPTRPVFQPQPVPVASFTAKPAAPGRAAAFDAGASQRAVGYSWDFGDGTVITDGGPAPRHVYAKPGVYDARLTVTDEQGCSSQQIYTGQSTTCPGGAEATTTVKLDTLPALSKLKVKPRKFAAGKGKRAGTKIRYRLSERAKVTLKIQRKKGQRYAGRGKLKDKGKPGRNKVRFEGVVRGKPLPPGRYRVSAVAKDSAGGKSQRLRARFRILGG